MFKRSYQRMGEDGSEREIMLPYPKCPECNATMDRVTQGSKWVEYECYKGHVMRMAKLMFIDTPGQKASKAAHNSVHGSLEGLQPSPGKKGK